jgi:Protein of unknown function (DUF1460)
VANFLPPQLDALAAVGLVAAMQGPISRRAVLQLMAALPMVAVGGIPAFAREWSLIGRLIAEASARPLASERIVFISRALLGVRYQADTLIGGARHKEVFVVRDDAFDCVTFCEVVLAAALARDLAEFKTFLRRLRYQHGKVKWEERNHYFADWSRRAVENRLCRPVVIEPSVTIRKRISWLNLGERQVSLTVILSASLLRNRDLLADGDLIGFVSRRPDLDFFHTGLIVFGKGRELMLRHASQHRGRTVDERMDAFVAASGVRYVTVLRAADGAAMSDAG